MTIVVNNELAADLLRLNYVAFATVRSKSNDLANHTAARNFDGREVSRRTYLPEHVNLRSPSREKKSGCDPRSVKERSAVDDTVFKR